MTTPPASGETFSVECPHCGKPFEAELMGTSERNFGFKCPHCRLFVAFKPDADDPEPEPDDRP